MTDAMRQLVEVSALPLKTVETDFAVDSTGFSTSRFERWYDHKWGKERSSRAWVKLHAMTGVRTNIVTAVELSGGHSHDTNYFRPLLATTVGNDFVPRDVTADKAYSSKANHQAVADAGAVAYIPFLGVPAHAGIPPEARSETSIFYRMQYLFAYQRDTFLSHYHQRSNVETTFSMIKRKFGDSLRSKSDVGQMNEVLCKVIAHNLCVLIASIHELGLSAPEFSQGCASLG
jgi:transposase